VVEIDDREFTLEEFGKMLVTYAGWGMRIEFVPDDAAPRARCASRGTTARSTPDDCTVIIPP
jgi:hypothetical protein